MKDVLVTQEEVDSDLLHNLFVVKPLASQVLGLIPQHNLKPSQVREEEKKRTTVPFKSFFFNACVCMSVCFVCLLVWR